MSANSHLNSAVEIHRKRLDEATAEIVRGINALLLKSQLEKLTTITTILKDARESIAWWAVHDDYHEPNAERLVQKLALESGLLVALDFLAKFATMKDSLLRQEMMDAIKEAQLKVPQLSVLVPDK